MEIRAIPFRWTYPFLTVPDQICRHLPASSRPRFLGLAPIVHRRALHRRSPSLPAYAGTGEPLTELSATFVARGPQGPRAGRIIRLWPRSASGLRLAKIVVAMWLTRPFQKALAQRGAARSDRDGGLTANPIIPVGESKIRVPAMLPFPTGPTLAPPPRTLAVGIVESTSWSPAGNRPIAHLLRSSGPPGRQEPPRPSAYGGGRLRSAVPCRGDIGTAHHAPPRFRRPTSR